MTQAIAIILVLYQQQLAETPNYQLLQEVAQKWPGKVQLFIYDNSPQAQTDCLFQEPWVIYQHNPENVGLAKAYNWAAERVGASDSAGLLLLDQDTVLSTAYLTQFITELLDPRLTYVPQIQASGRQISPMNSQQVIGRTTQAIGPGVYQTPIMAINSGTFLTRETLQALGSFNEDFALDFLDHWLFWQLHQLQRPVRVLEASLMHDLSVLHYETMSLKRYHSILTAETLFYQNYDQANFTAYRHQLLKRLLKQFLTVKNRQIWRATGRQWLEIRRNR